MLFYNLTLLKLNYCVYVIYILQPRRHKISGLNAKWRVDDMLTYTNQPVWCSLSSNTEVVWKFVPMLVME
jgi:hypothetical protein